MKKRPSKRYLILSSAHLGMSEKILNLFAKTAKHYGAQVIHLGPTVTEQEYAQCERLKKAHDRILDELKTCESESKLKDLEKKEEALFQGLETMLSAEDTRVKTLLSAFGKVHFVTNPKLSLFSLFTKKRIKDKGFSYTDGGVNLSSHLFLSPVPPTGNKSVRTPINTNSISYLKQLGKSWIVAHPVPAVENMPKIGLNNTWNYFTVGSLQEQFRPLRTRDQFQFSHIPAAIFAVVDDANGEFHARHLFIDKIANEYAILDDGLVFTQAKTIEVPSEDRATFSTDEHTPYEHPGHLAAVRAVNDLYKPETFIGGGDTADFDPVSRHTKGVPGERENLRLSDCLNSLKMLLDAQTEQKSIKKRILIDSNHHEWLSNFVMENPELIGLLDWKTLAFERFKGWDIMIREAGDNKVYMFGDYVIRHGDKDGGAKKAELIFDHGKYVCGHFHRFQGYKRAFQIGCGAMLGPSYIGNQINAWQNQLATFTKHKGVASISPKIVLHDKNLNISRVCYRGDIYEVDHYILPHARKNKKHNNNK